MLKVPEDIWKLDERIRHLKAKEALARKDKPESPYVYASKTGFRVATELLSGVLVGAAIGFFLDRMLDTKPWLLVVFLLLGGVAGILNVYRFVQSEENKKKE